MKKIRIVNICVVTMVILLLVTSCSSTKNVSKGKENKLINTSSMEYIGEIVKHQSKVNAFTAKMNISVSIDGKEYSLGGNMRMRKNDVVQLSLSFLGMEVAKLEFSPTDVLVINRFQSQYGRLPYDKISFLRNAKVDFNVIQALFWNELFIPGVPDVSSSYDKFMVTSSGNHTLIGLYSAPELDYAFLSETSKALIKKVTVTQKNDISTENVSCRYDDFVSFEGGQFPTSISMKFKGNKTYTLDIRLSNLKSSSEWQPHTEVSSKYQLIDVEKLLNGIKL